MVLYEESPTHRADEKISEELERLLKNLVVKDASGSSIRIVFKSNPAN
jgi:hypothetical protein